MQDTIQIQLSQEEISELIGPSDINLNTISKFFHVNIIFRDDDFIIQSDDQVIIHKVTRVIETLSDIVKKGKRITEQNVIYACRIVDKEEDMNVSDMSIPVGRNFNGKFIYPKTKGQSKLVEAMRNNSITFALGPAGTGKTYLAVVHAVTALKNDEVKRIVLTRPAVEAGENLGFLPGDLKEKVDPYLTPLYDALYEMLGHETTEKLIERGTIEIAPLAYMRGRTLHDAFIILDEAQNTTDSQMKMFLTRLGFKSKMVIGGDTTQVDLKGFGVSGLNKAASLLENVEDIAVIHLQADDVVRHPLVQKIIEEYEKRDATSHY